eukprot:superscaffoldBa00001150_g9191
MLDLRDKTSLEPVGTENTNRENEGPSQNASISGPPVLKKFIVLMKARDDGVKPETPPEVTNPTHIPDPKQRNGRFCIEQHSGPGYVFRAQTQEIKERGGNRSTGIDFFITQERVIFLDTQPMLSPSILDHLINDDQKLPPEYNLPYTYVEMQ